VKVQDATISNAIVSYATISNVKDQDATISNVKVQDATISNVKVQDAMISNVKVQDATISNVKVQDETISNVKVQDATIRVNLIRNANFQAIEVIEVMIENLRDASLMIVLICATKNRMEKKIAMSVILAKENLENGNLALAILRTAIQTKIETKEIIEPMESRNENFPKILNEKTIIQNFQNQKGRRSNYSAEFL
jgi:uncharacterized protein YjbI with pentapeptide repeats